MNIAPFLAKACQELDKAMQGTLDGTKIACISETISGYAIAAAIASGVAGVAPGFAGVAAALTQAGFVWATYVKINKTLDISMSENTAKFIGSAIVTNLITSAGAFVAVLIGSSIVSIIPGAQVVSVAMNAALGYTIVYVSAIIYLKLITRMMQPDGTLKVSESDDTKHIIRNIIKDFSFVSAVIHILGGHDHFRGLFADLLEESVWAFMQQTGHITFLGITAVDSFTAFNDSGKTGQCAFNRRGSVF